MSEGLITTIILAVVGPALTLMLNQWYQRRKNRADYGDDLLDVLNKATSSLRETREEMASLEAEIRQNDLQHEEEIRALKRGWDERQQRMKDRIKELEKIIVKYEISFTMQTHPTVQINDLRIVAKEDVLASQKLSALTPERIRAEQEKRKK